MIAHPILIDNIETNELSMTSSSKVYYGFPIICQYIAIAWLANASNVHSPNTPHTAVFLVLGCKRNSGEAFHVYWGSADINKLHLGTERAKVLLNMLLSQIPLSTNASKACVYITNKYAAQKDWINMECFDLGTVVRGSRKVIACRVRSTRYSISTMMSAGKLWNISFSTENCTGTAITTLSSTCGVNYFPTNWKVLTVAIVEFYKCIDLFSRAALQTRCDQAQK